MEKQRKRVTDFAKKYTLRDQIIYYCQIGKKERKVPANKDCRQLVEQAHLVGHFEERATTQRQAENNYWANMKQEVKDTIDHCLACLRHCSKPVQENTARAIPI